MHRCSTSTRPVTLACLPIQKTASCGKEGDLEQQHQRQALMPQIRKPALSWFTESEINFLKLSVFITCQSARSSCSLLCSAHAACTLPHGHLFSMKSALAGIVHATCISLKKEKSFGQECTDGEVVRIDWTRQSDSLYTPSHRSTDQRSGLSLTLWRSIHRGAFQVIWYPFIS